MTALCIVVLIEEILLFSFNIILSPLFLLKTRIHNLSFFYEYFICSGFFCKLLALYIYGNPGFIAFMAHLLPYIYGNVWQPWTLSTAPQQASYTVQSPVLSQSC